MYNPHRSMKGWKLETFCNKQRKEFEFWPAVAKSLTSFMKGIMYGISNLSVLYFPQIFGVLGVFFVGFVGFFFFAGFFNLFYFKRKTETRKSEVRLLSGSHIGIEDCKLSSDYSLMKLCSASDLSCSSLNFILTSFYQNISPTKQLLNC